MPKSSKAKSGNAAATAVAVAAAKKTTSQPKATGKSAVGAPSQHKQTSRKGKKAWRKNVNIEDVEKGLEEIRSEERAVGTALHNLKDSDLFEVDVKGDDKIRHIAPKFLSSQLTSAKILAQRSAVPPVFSRPSSSTSTSGKRKAGTLSREDKDRLMKIAKRQRRGPFGAVMDPSELQSGEGIVELSEAVKQSGAYDPWNAEADEVVVEVKDGLETVQPKKVKPPPTTKPKDMIEVAAVVEPHQGTSYNPPVNAHSELLVKAAEIEARKIEELERMAVTKKKMDAAKFDADEVFDIGLPAGMKLDKPTEDAPEGEEEESGDEQAVRKQPKPKTKAQKAKAAKHLAEKRALAAAAARKKQLALIEQAKGLRRSNARLSTAQEKAVAEKKLAAELKIKQAGLGGQRLGRHKVPEGQIDVQLGEDLSESLRALKPEGNLFRDRFQSLQQRALVEPRVRVLPKRRTHKIVEYEKHAWKNFDRE
ncbi:hypothetical protein D9611_012064 [Ephemerocybe angulata]|uniref:Ribosome biogenesis protein NOP53 n=1 Tax=Ephemerocybe angulata TaxID=980116 RepID=A0A8H5AT23_9AGAR|nr:hypothetical protein D9611_012064 [Tulosesus angulatus]